MHGWMRGACSSLLWVEKCLSNFLSVTPPPAGIMQVILLNSYQCHMMGTIVDVIQELGVEVIHIPDGCMRLLQPLNVGLNNQFKVRV